LVESLTDRKITFKIKTSVTTDKAVLEFWEAANKYLSVGVSGMTKGLEVVQKSGSELPRATIVDSEVGFADVGGNRTVSIPILFGIDFGQRIYDLKLGLYSIGGICLDSLDSNRDLKIWNCQVGVSGGIYDGSAGSVC